MDHLTSWIAPAVAIGFGLTALGTAGRETPQRAAMMRVGGVMGLIGGAIMVVIVLLGGL